jgi:hydrogenase expression/formation protein HypC
VCLAIPGKIIELCADEPQLAVVDVGGVRRRVNIDLLREESLGVADWVLIHVGFAMSKISVEDAEEQMRLLAMLGEDQQAIQELEGYQFG